MNIVGISGSPVKRDSYFLLECALDAIRGATSKEIIHLNDYRLELCRGCNNCLREEKCIQNDDLSQLVNKLLKADGIIIASPTYFANVSGILKNFMDRTRYLKMHGSKLKNKYLGAITTSGLNNGGAQSTIEAIYRFGLWHGMNIVAPIGEKGTNMVIGTLEKENGWQSIKKDDKGIKLAENLGERMYNVLK